MKAVIAGGRDVHMTPEGFERVYRIFALYNITTLANGKCPTGIDADAIKAAKNYGVQVVEFPAEWDKYGKSAGPKRNRKMLDFIFDGILIVFSGGKGTADILKEAIERNIPVIHLEGDKYATKIIN